VVLNVKHLTYKNAVVFLSVRPFVTSSVRLSVSLSVRQTRAL